LLRAMLHSFRLPLRLSQVEEKDPTAFLGRLLLREENRERDPLRNK
jgi:hypothetical protein